MQKENKFHKQKQFVVSKAIKSLLQIVPYS